VARYANQDGDAAAISIDAGVTQNLGVRLATVRRGPLASRIDAVGVLEYNARDVAQVQTRAGGFVERVYRHAPGDLIEKGAPLADLLIPEWAAAQEEYLALRRAGDAALLGVEPGQPDHQAGRKHGPDQNQQAGTDCQLLHHSFFSIWRAVREERQIGKSEA